MHRTLALIIVPLALAGCNKPKPAEPVAGASGGAAISGAGLPHPQPGLYRSTVTLVSLAAPGRPPGVADQMKAAMARRSEGQTYCLKPEEAERGYESRVRQLA